MSADEFAERFKRELTEWFAKDKTRKEFEQWKASKDKHLYNYSIRGEV